MYMDPSPNNSNFNLQEDDNIDVKRYVSLFISNWYWFAISLLIALTLAYAINRYSSKLYVVASTLMIKDDQFAGGNRIVGSVIPGGDIFRSQQNMTNEISILKSYSLNRRVIDSLPEFQTVYYAVGKRNIAETQLYKICPFKVTAESIAIQPKNIKVNIRINSAKTYLLDFNGNKGSDIEIKFGERFSGYGFDFIIDLRDKSKYIFIADASNKFYFYFVGADELANIYRGALSVAPIDKESTIVNLSKTGFVPNQEVDYLNKLMDVYIMQGLETKNRMADNTIKFIDQQLGVVSDSLRRVEKKLQKLRLDNKLIDLSKDGTLLQSRYEKYDNEKTSLELQRHYFEYLQGYLESKDETGDIVSPNVMGVTEPTVGKLVQELNDLQKTKRQLALNLSEDLPPLNNLAESIHKLRLALSENIKNSLANTESLLDSANFKLEQVNKEIVVLPATESKRINIQRDFDINNTVYTYLLEKRAETGIAKASNVSDNKIIDRAQIFNAVQIRPESRGNYIKALLFGMLTPAIIIFFLYFLNNKIIDNEDIFRKTKVPVIGYISHNDSKEEVPVITNPKSSLTESFRSIRTSLKYFIKESDHSVVAITSTISSEGKTFISINLAAITALLGKKVLLIGLDLRRPRIHKILGIDNSVGLTSYLIGNCKYEDVIKETSIANLYYATSGPVPPNPAELIEDESMDKFIAKARKEFDYIFIDTPPVAIVSDTLLITRFVDVNLFIVRQRYSSKNTLELINELYKDEKLKHMSIIINDISLTGYYGYGIRYGYYKGYGYSYGKNYYGQYSYSRYGYSDKEHGYYNT
jgi:tyrosine-protein kinase Etk/Wzc